MTYGAQQTVAKPSLNSLPTEPGTEATSNGSLSTNWRHWSWISLPILDRVLRVRLWRIQPFPRQWGDLAKSYQSSEFYRYRNGRGRHQRQSVCWRRRQPVSVPSLVKRTEPTGHAKFRSKRYGRPWWRSYSGWHQWNRTLRADVRRGGSYRHKQ